MGGPDSRFLVGDGTVKGAELCIELAKSAP